MGAPSAPRAPAASRPFAALGVPNYRRYFTGQIFFFAGKYIQQVALSWLVLEITDSSVVLGLVTALQFLPVLIFALTAGVFVDRLPKRGLLMGLQVGTFVPSAALAILSFHGSVQLWQVFVLAFLIGCVNSFDSTTRNAFVANLVDRDRLQSAISLNSAGQNLARIGGPAVAGIVIAAGGTAWCFLVNSVAVLVVLLMLALLRADEIHQPRPPSEGSVVEQLADGLRYVRSEPALTLPLLLQLFIGMFGLNFIVTLPLISRFVFDAGAVGLGFLAAARGIGAVCGSVVVAGALHPSPRTLVIAAALFGSVMLLVGLAPVFAIAIALVGVLGGIEVFYLASVQTTFLLSAREEYRGRLLSLNAMLTAGATPVGGPLTGTVAEILGVRAAVIVNASCCIAGAALGHLLVRRRRAAAQMA